MRPMLIAHPPELSAGAAGRPLRPPLAAHLSVEAARARLAREGLSFVVVQVGPAQRLAGVATTASVQPGPCCARRGGKCSVVHHLDPAAAFCFADEPLDEVLRAEAEIASERAWAARPAPLIVVDRELRPVGYLAAGGPCTAGTPLRAA